MKNLTELGLILLALLKLIIQKSARLLVALIDLKTFKEHFLIHRTGALQLLLLRIGHGTSGILGSGLLFTTATKASRYSAYSLVGNRRTCSKCHTLCNSAAKS
jgi:hypothetical protein